MSTPAPTTPTTKMSKFLRPEWRDRPRSSSGDGAAASASESPARMSRMIGKKGSKLFGKNKDEDAESSSTLNKSANASNVGISDPPVIIEPPSNSKPRPRPPRPSNSNENYNGSSYPNGVSSSTSAPSGSSASMRNMGDMSARLSGWFTHAFSGSSTDLSLPNILSSSNLSASQVLAGSPKSKPSHPLILAATKGKDHLDKAMRYLLDSDAQPDRSTDKIWLLGQEHPGYEPPPPPPSMPSTTSNPASPTSTLSPPTKRSHRRDSTDSRTKSPSSFRNPIPITHSNSSTQSLSSAVSSSTANPNAPNNKTGIAWPPDFYSDYTSRVWLTYRNTFPPIRDTSLASLEPISCSTTQNHSSTDVSGPQPSPIRSKWPWGTEKGWTSDAGWGCMLRTGQSLLANSLIHLHLSRSWRRPTQPTFTPEYVQYVRILTWFLDTPSPQSPFGIHRMALAGKELGKEVGSWFGPSTAAGAIKRLVGEFEDAGLEVVVAVDSVVYQTDVYAASCTPRGPTAAAAAANGSKGSAIGASKQKKAQQAPKWGDRAVLVLVGIRLGIDGVNPIYYDSVKALFTFPQSVGIAGGRPSSSYYFVGSQGDSLFYLDPHHTRPAVPLRPPPSLSTFDEISMASTDDGLSQASSRLGKRRGSDLHARGHASTPDTSESDRRSSTKRLSIRRASINRVSSYQQQQQVGTPTSPSSVHSGSSLSQPSAPVSVAGSHAHSQSHSSYSGHSTVPMSSSPLARTNMPPSSHRPTSSSPTRVPSSSAIPLSPSSSGFPPTPSTASSHGMAMPLSPTTSTTTLDPMSAFLATAYPITELRTFHCERVRKMPLSGLDPSMLLGFLCRDEKDWKDLRERVAEMAKSKKAIFSIQDEPPVWPDDEDDDLDLESASSDQDAEEIESPVGAEGEDELDDNELEIKRRPAKLDAAKVDLGNDSDDENDEAEELSAVTPIAPSTKFAASRHDTIVGRARPEMAAAAAAASKTAKSHHHDRKDSRENDGDDDDELDDDDDDDWVDPIKPSPPLNAPSAANGKMSNSSSSIGSARRGSQDSGSRVRGKGDDASVTPRPMSASQQISPTSSTISTQSRSRPAAKELPAIPTTLVSMSRDSSRPSSRPSSAQRRSSQVALSDAPVPFPSRTSEHRKHSSASSRSATSSSSIPASTGSSPASHYPGHGATNSSSSNSHSNSHSHSHHRQHHSGTERDATAYPFPGSMTDESGTTSSDSGPSSDAWGGDEKQGARGSLVPKRERRTTVGRSGALAPVPTPTKSAVSGHGTSVNTLSHSVERMSSIKAKEGGRTTSGGVRAVWKDEDGDDF